MQLNVTVTRGTIFTNPYSVHLKEEERASMAEFMATPLRQKWHVVHKPRVAVRATASTSGRMVGSKVRSTSCSYRARARMAAAPAELLLSL